LPRAIDHRDGGFFVQRLVETTQRCSAEAKPRDIGRGTTELYAVGCFQSSAGRAQ
jgi:hypothetical protein